MASKEPITPPQTPPTDPNSDEADETQLTLARRQGDAYQAALLHMAREVAHDGGTVRAGEYLVGCAVEEAEGMYVWSGDDVEWRDPGEHNAHLEIAVCDGADGRFVPGLDVTATVVTADGSEVGTETLPLLWHPMIYHYGCNWKVPGDGEYTVRVRIAPPKFMRHDRKNGRRFLEPVNAEFTGVQIKAGQD